MNSDEAMMSTREMRAVQCSEVEERKQLVMCHYFFREYIKDYYGDEGKVF